MAAWLCARAVLLSPTTAQPGQGPHICPFVQGKGLSELQDSSITQLPLGTCTWASLLQKPRVRSKGQASLTHGTVRLCLWEHVGDLRKSRDQISLPLCYDSKDVCAIFSISACCWHSQRPASHGVGWSAQGRGCVVRPSLTDRGRCCVPGTACPLHPCFIPLCYFTY